TKPDSRQISPQINNRRPRETPAVMFAFCILYSRLCGSPQCEAIVAHVHCILYRLPIGVRPTKKITIDLYDRADFFTAVHGYSENLTVLREYQIRSIWCPGDAVWKEFCRYRSDQ